MNKKIIIVLLVLAGIALFAFQKRVGNIRLNKVDPVQKKIENTGFTPVYKGEIAVNLVADLQEVSDFIDRAKKAGKTIPLVGIDDYPTDDNNFFLIQVYEDIKDSADSGRTVTFGWYRVYPDTWTITKLDLSTTDTWSKIDNSNQGNNLIPSPTVIYKTITQACPTQSQNNCPVCADTSMKDVEISNLKQALNFSKQETALWLSKYQYCYWKN